MQIDVESDLADSLDGLGNTFRAEGISVTFDELRIGGKNIDLKTRIEDLRLGRKIGQGACSSVTLAIHKTTNQFYAVKSFNVYDKSQRSQMLKEIITLLHIDCPTLIKLQGIFHCEGNIGVILDYMNLGSLDSRIFTQFIRDMHATTQNELKHKLSTAPKNTKLSSIITINHLEIVLSCIIYQVLWGLAYLHYDHNLHRDIKLGNIIVNSDGEVKLSDFGISKNLDNTTAMSNTAVGEPYNDLADIWSTGVVLLELLNNQNYPFTSTNNNINNDFTKTNLNKSSMMSFASTNDMDYNNIHSVPAKNMNNEVTSPIDLIGILETTNIDNTINTIINNNYPMIITPQIRNFLSKTLQYNAKNRSTALYNNYNLFYKFYYILNRELLQSSPVFQLYNISYLETAQNTLKHYIKNFIPKENYEINIDIFNLSPSNMKIYRSPEVINSYRNDQKSNKINTTSTNSSNTNNNNPINNSTKYPNLLREISSKSNSSNSNYYEDDFESAYDSSNIESNIETDNDYYTRFEHNSDQKSNKIIYTDIDTMTNEELIDEILVEHGSDTSAFNRYTTKTTISTATDTSNISDEKQSNNRFYNNFKDWRGGK